MKKFLSMLLAIVMVFGFATPAMAEQTEEPVGYAPAGSVQPLGSPFGIWLYVTAPECDCGTDCGAEVRVTGGIKSRKIVGLDWVVEPYNEVLTAGSKTLQVYFNSSNPVTIEAVCGSCQYDFTEWEIAEDRILGDKVTTASESKLVIDEKSFLVPTYYTAKFQTEKTYTVKYVDGVDGAAFADQSYTVKYNEATPAFSGTPTREGYNFLGWEPRVADKVTADATYTAQWEVKEFTVKYVDGVDGEEVFADQSYTVKYNEATPAFSGTPTREGYNFLGWEPRVAEKVTADATYAAQWEAKEFTVKYVDGVDGEEVFADKSYTVKYNEATPAFQGDLTKYPGWKFKAWTPDLADTVTEDVTYTATWEPKGANTIIYWGNGGTRSKYSVGDTFWSEYTSAAEIKVRGNGFLSFALDEYAFNGWNTKADGTGDSYKSGDMYKFTAAHDLDKANLYAQWEHVACDKHLEDVKVITEPTCTEDGLKLCRCTVCGKEMEVEIPALGHDHRGNWTWNREEHWKKCLRCDAIIDCEEHTYGDWKPVVDEKGKDTDREERSCTVCGFTQYSQTLHIGGNTITKPTDEQNPNTGAQVPSLLPALAVLAGAAILLGKRK